MRTVISRSLLRNIKKRGERTDLCRHFLFYFWGLGAVRTHLGCRTQMRIIITHDFSPFFTFSKIMGRKTSRYCEKLHDPKPLLSANYMANLFFHRDRDPFTNVLHKICIKYIKQGLSRIVCELRSQIRHCPG